MKTFLDSLNHVEKIDVKDIVIDIDKYNLYSVNAYQIDDILYFKDKRNDKLKRQFASNYAYKLLKKGFGVYFDNVVYFMPTLDNQYCLNSKIEDLKKDINKALKYRTQFNYEFTKHIIEERNFNILKGYVDMYERKLVDRDWIRKRIKGKVNNVDKVIEIDFPEVI